MVKIESNKEKDFHRILLRPNQSISWKSSIVFILVIAFTCLTIGLGFAYVGATLILPFAGLEVLFVGICVERAGSSVDEFGWKIVDCHRAADLVHIFGFYEDIVSWYINIWKLYKIYSSFYFKQVLHLIG